MSSSTFPLCNLPFDVLHQVIEILDRGDIYSLCQVSRGFDAIGAPVLYRTLKWDEEAGFLHSGAVEDGVIYRPCLAFRRRPLLRGYAQTVTLISRTNRWGLRLQVPYVRLICEELRLLPSLYRLEWHEWQLPDFYVYQGKFSFVVDAVAKLRSIREIRIPYVDVNGPQVLSSLSQAFNGISIRLGTYPDIVTEWLGKQQEHLQELHIVVPNGSTFALSNNFHALRRFSQVTVTNVPGFLEAIQGMNQLQELSIGIPAEVIYSWDATTQPAKLSKLQSLKITILEYYQQPYKTFSQAILYCYMSLGASPCPLHTVHICVASPQIESKMPGDKIFSKIIRDHAESIRVLRLDDMTAAEDILVRLFSRCTRLEELGLKVLMDRRVTLSTFDTLGPLSGTLQSLHLVVVPGVPIHHLQKVEAFLLQAVSPLRRINMWLTGVVPRGVMGHRSRHFSWQRRWLHDEDLCVPRQYVTVISESEDLWRDKN